MAKYDIPSMVEKVVEVTGQEEIFYAGHSMGTTAFMAMGHYRPDIMDRIILANLLAPVTSEANMGGPLGWIAEAGEVIGVSFCPFPLIVVSGHSRLAWSW